jgi:hypothetical protein
MNDSASAAVWRCEECGEPSNEDELGPALYECSQCGDMFNRDSSADGCSNHCPDCNRFGAKVDDHSCPHCWRGPLDLVQAEQDDDGELVEPDGPHDKLTYQEARALTDTIRAAMTSVSSTMADNVTVVTDDTITTWADRIRGHMARTVEAIVATGRELVEAKVAVGRGNWLPLLLRVGIGEDTAERFMAIASNGAFLNSATLRNLPPNHTTMATLARLDPDQIAAAVAAERITPNTTNSEAARLVRRLRAGEQDESDKPGEGADVDVDDLAGVWLNYINLALKKGARFAEAAEAEGVVLGGHAAFALILFRQFSERQLDAEIRAFYESESPE